jgi:hypothetical protein
MRLLLATSGERFHDEHHLMIQAPEVGDQRTRRRGA